MASSIPLLNEYKQVFFWKRLPQTILGGPKLRLGYDAPIYVYIGQVVLFIIPLLFGIALTVIAEVITAVNSTVVCFIMGGLMFVYALVINIISAVARAKKSSVAPIMRGGAATEEGEVQFESCCGIETLEFVIPGKKLKVNIVLHALIAAAISGLGCHYLLPSNLDELYNNSIAATVVICGLGWLVISIAMYSLTVSPPPEWAQFRTIDIREIYTPLMRAFYISIFCAVDIANL